MYVRSVCATLIVLFSIGFSKNCKWVYDPDVVDYPVGVNRCNYVEVTTGNNARTFSFKYSCSSTSSVTMYKYLGSFDCSGTYSESDVTDYVSYECGSDYDVCGKAFGTKTPCDCTAADKNCDTAISISLVDNICLYSTSSDYSYEWYIQCGSVSSAYARQYQYSNTKCSGDPYQTNTYHAGCQTAKNSNNETDWIICPANKSTFSVVVLAIALISSILFL